MLFLILLANDLANFPLPVTSALNLICWVKDLRGLPTNAALWTRSTPRDSAGERNQLNTRSPRNKPVNFHQC